jgi:hypothetical protein
VRAGPKVGGFSAFPMQIGVTSGKASISRCLAIDNFDSRVEMHDSACTDSGWLYIVWDDQTVGFTSHYYNQYYSVLFYFKP